MDPETDSRIRLHGISDPRVLAAMRAVPRAAFVPPELVADAYADSPLPIGFGQTISQPYIVAWMTETLQIAPGMKVLEVGTGSGYQTAILAELGANVFSIEIIAELSARAETVLRQLGYERVHLRIGSGYLGWPEEAPFDRIILTAAPRELPQILVDELADGGRLVAPVGGMDAQVMTVITRHGGQISRRETIAVRFVEMKERRQSS
jgi:protein-L-isoaspartate(D-aspartate) O-methyltransferase